MNGRRQSTEAPTSRKESARRTICHPGISGEKKEASAEERRLSADRALQRRSDVCMDPSLQALLRDQVSNLVRRASSEDVGTATTGQAPQGILQKPEASNGNCRKRASIRVEPEQCAPTSSGQGVEQMLPADGVEEQILPAEASKRTRKVSIVCPEVLQQLQESRKSHDADAEGSGAQISENRTSQFEDVTLPEFQELRQCLQELKASPLSAAVHRVLHSIEAQMCKVAKLGMSDSWKPETFEDWVQVLGSQSASTLQVLSTCTHVIRHMQHCLEDDVPNSTVEYSVTAMRRCLDKLGTFSSTLTSMTEQVRVRISRGQAGGQSNGDESPLGGLRRRRRMSSVSIAVQRRDSVKISASRAEVIEAMQTRAAIGSPRNRRRASTAAEISLSPRSREKRRVTLAASMHEGWSSEGSPLSPRSLIDEDAASTHDSCNGMSPRSAAWNFDDDIKLEGQAGSQSPKQCRPSLLMISEKKASEQLAHRESSQPVAPSSSTDPTLQQDGQSLQVKDQHVEELAAEHAMQASQGNQQHAVRAAQGSQQQLAPPAAQPESILVEEVPGVPGDMNSEAPRNLKSPRMDRQGSPPSRRLSGLPTVARRSSKQNEHSGPPQAKQIPLKQTCGAVPEMMITSRAEKPSPRRFILSLDLAGHAGEESMPDADRPEPMEQSSAQPLFLSPCPSVLSRASSDKPVSQPFSPCPSDKGRSPATKASKLSLLVPSRGQPKPDADESRVCKPQAGQIFSTLPEGKDASPASPKTTRWRNSLKLQRGSLMQLPRGSLMPLFGSPNSHGEEEDCPPTPKDSTSTPKDCVSTPNSDMHRSSQLKHHTEKAAVPDEVQHRAAKVTLPDVLGRKKVAEATKPDQERDLELYGRYAMDFFFDDDFLF